MTQNRVRIVDVADALGLSTATISNVIHGKTEKISDETVKRVQQELERSGYIPNMAGILLARNNSRIIGVVVNDHEKYEGRVLEDGFVMSSLNALSHEVNEKGYFLMIKTTSDIREIPVFASMWNMDGLILIGFCEADYESLRNQMRISFVVYDGYFEKVAERLRAVLTDETRLAILKLKYETPETEKIIGIEYYQAVIRDGVRSYAEFEVWRQEHPVTGIVEWMP